MLTFAQQTGHNPDDMTVQQYTEFMEWYNARKDFLNGAYSQQEIDAYDAANPAPQPIDATETITNNTQPNAAPTVESINNIVTLPKGSEDWYENSLNEYFEANPKVWENMQNLELRYVISNNDRFLDANLAGNPLALNFRSALIQYLNENKMSIGRHETLRDFMRDLALRQKDGGVTFKDMLLGQTVAPAATPTPDLGDALYNNISDETVMAAKPAANIANAAGINATGINPTLNQQIAWANVDEANKILEANTPAAPSAPVASPVTLETEPNLMSNDSVLEQANIDEANRIIREGINNAPTAAPIIEAAQEKAADYGLNSFAVNANNLTVNQMAWVTENASELLNETALTGGAHMQDMITKFGFDTYVSQFQNKTIEEVLSASRPTEGGEFYDLISNLAKANPDLAQEFPNVNNFLLQSYVQDEKLHLAMEAVPTPKPVAPVLEEVGNDATPY